MIDRELQTEKTPPLIWGPFELNDGDMTARLHTKEGETGTEEVAYLQIKPYKDFVLVKHRYVHPTYRRAGVFGIMDVKIKNYLKLEKKIGLRNDHADWNNTRPEQNVTVRKFGWQPIDRHPSWFMYIPQGMNTTVPTQEQMTRMITEADPAYMKRRSTWA